MNDRTPTPQSIPTRLTLSAPLELAEGSGDGPKKFSGIAYSGGLAKSYGVVIDLATTTAAAPLPLLLEHERGAVIGAIGKVANSGTQLGVDGELFSDIDEDAAALVEKAKRIKYQMSVGIFDFTYEFIPAGKTVTVNGQSFNGPIDVLHNGVIREVSVCVLGADSNTSVSFFSLPPEQRHALRLAAGQSSEEVPPMDIAELKGKVDGLEAQVKTLSAQLDAEKTAKEAAEAQLAEQAAATRKEQVKALFADLKRDYSDDAAKPYLAMAQADFDAVAKDLRAAKPNLPGHLFSEQAKGGQAPAGAGTEAKLSTTDIYAARRQIAK
jgi:hypothetical protein